MARDVNKKSADKKAPIYEYQHLYKKFKDPEKAFEAYLEENPEYSKNTASTLESAYLPDVINRVTSIVHVYYCGFPVLA